MKFIYIDESGDPGQNGSDHFILTGVIVPETQWRTYLDSLHSIRQTIKQNHSLPVRTELHGAELFYPRGSSQYNKLKGRKERLEIYSYFLKEISARLQDIRIVNIYVDKTKIDWASDRAKSFEEFAWTSLLQRFHNHLLKDCENESGMVFADQTNERKLRSLVRKLRIFNHVPSLVQQGTSRSIPLSRIVEDPIIRDSAESWFVQIADLASHSLYRKLHVKGSFRRFNADKLFDHLDPVLLKAASRTDPHGIVRL